MGGTAASSKESYKFFRIHFAKDPKLVLRGILSDRSISQLVCRNKTEVVRRVFKNVNDGVHPSQSDWLEALLSYNSLLLGTPSRRNLFHVQNLLRAMATEGLVAHIPISFRSRRPKASGHYPTLAEAKHKLAPVNRNNETSADDYLLLLRKCLVKLALPKASRLMPVNKAPLFIVLDRNSAKQTSSVEITRQK